MPDELHWPRVKVSDLVNAGALTINDGYRVRNVELGVSGIPFVRGGDIGDGNVNTDVRDHILPELRDRVAAKLTRPLDVAFITKGTVGRVGLLRHGQPTAVFAPQVSYWRATDPNLLDSRYLLYLLRSTYFGACLNAVKTHGAMAADYVSLSDQRQFELPIAPIDQQRAIAAVLGALDDKIEANRNIARALEEIARALFTSWFVDFDPIRLATLPANLAVLFPKRLVDSPLGEIPDGWKAGALRDLLRLSRDAMDPGEYPTEEFDHFSIPAFDAGQVPTKDMGESIKSQKLLFADGCVLVSKLNPQTPRIWLPPPRGSRRQVASTEFLVCIGEQAKQVSREFVYCVTTSVRLVEHLITHATGTSNSHQRVRPQDFLDFPSVLPPPPVLAAFSQSMKPSFDRIAASRAQSVALTALRDTLLPKLISGEIRIADAEQLAGRAA